MALSYTLSTKKAPPNPKSAPISNLQLAPTGSLNLIVYLYPIFELPPPHKLALVAGNITLSLQQYPLG